MDAPKPDILVLILECKDQATRDRLNEESSRIEGCRTLFVGVDLEGNHVLIQALTGKALRTPASDIHRCPPYPVGPRFDELVRYTLIPSVSIKEST